MAEAEAEGERLVRANALFDRERMSVEGIEGLAPIFTAMDVGAVGELEAVIESHGGYLRKSTLALRLGVRKWSGSWICTLTWSVPFWRSASGAISATWPV